MGETGTGKTHFARKLAVKTVVCQTEDELKIAITRVLKRKLHIDYWGKKLPKNLPYHREEILLEVHIIPPPELAGFCKIFSIPTLEEKRRFLEENGVPTEYAEYLMNWWDLTHFVKLYKDGYRVPPLVLEEKSEEYWLRRLGWRWWRWKENYIKEKILSYI